MGQSAVFTKTLFLKSNVILVYTICNVRGTDKFNIFLTKCDSVFNKMSQKQHL